MLDIDVVNKFIASLSEEEIKEPELVANIAEKILMAFGYERYESMAMHVLVLTAIDRLKESQQSQ